MTALSAAETGLVRPVARSGRAGRAINVLAGLVAGRPGRIGLVLFAFALRTWRLGAANVWWDEGLAIWAVRKPIVDATLWTAADVHPPLYFWLLWVWVRLAGQTEFAARFLTVLLGVVAVALAHALGRRLGGRRAGLLALAIVACARFEVWWSMEMRMYMLAGVCILAATLAAVGWLPSLSTGPDVPAGSRRRWLVAYVVAATAALYTVYWSAAALAVIFFAVGYALNARLGLDRRKPVPPDRHTLSRAARWLAAQLAVVALFSPWLAVALPRMQTWAAQRGEPASLSFVVRLWSTLLATGVSTDLERAWGWTALFWFAALVAPTIVWWLVRDRPITPPRLAHPGAGTLLVGFLVLAPLAVWGVTRPRGAFYIPAVEARYLLPFAAPVYVLLALALVAAWRRSRLAGAVLVIGTLVPLLATLPGHYAERRTRDDLRSMVLAVWSQAEPGDAVLLVSGNRYPEFLYYYDQPWDVEQTAVPYAWPPDAPPRGSDRPPVIPFPGRGSEGVTDVDWQARIEAEVAAHPRLWLAEVDAHLQDPDGRVRARLDAALPRVLSEAYGANALHLYAASGSPCQVTGVSSRWPGVRAPAAPLPASLAPVIGVPCLDLHLGDPMNVTLWQVSEDVIAGRADRVIVDAAVSHTVPERIAPAVFATGAGDPFAPARGWATTVVDHSLPGGTGDVSLVLDDGTTIALAAIRVRGTAPPITPGAPRLAYLTGRALPGRWSRPDARFGVPELASAAIGADAVRRGGSLVVDLYWAGPFTDAHSAVVRDADALPVVFVHLLGPTDSRAEARVWAAHDARPSSLGDSTMPPDGAVFDRHVLDVDPASPPGTYEVEVGLYFPETGERVAVTGEDADAESRRVVVGTVTVR